MEDKFRNLDKTRESTRHHFSWLQSQKGCRFEKNRKYIEQSLEHLPLYIGLFDLEIFSSFCLIWLFNSEPSLEHLENLEIKLFDDVFMISWKQNILANFQISVKTSVSRKIFSSSDILRLTDESKQKKEKLVYVFVNAYSL